MQSSYRRADGHADGKRRKKEKNLYWYCQLVMIVVSENRISIFFFKYNYSFYISSV